MKTNMTHAQLHSHNETWTGLLYGMSMFTVGFFMGIFRVLFLVPSFGELAAVFIETPIILPICWYLSQRSLELCYRRLPGKQQLSASEAFSMGYTALLTLLILEVGLSVFLFHMVLEEIQEEFLSAKGIVGLSAQMLASLFPAIQVSGRDIKADLHLLKYFPIY
jgi:hypothetical protein